MTRSAESVRLGFATVDVDREHRQGLPEVVYGSGKSAAEIAAIVSVLLELSAGQAIRPASRAATYRATVW